MRVGKQKETINNKVRTNTCAQSCQEKHPCLDDICLYESGCFFLQAYKNTCMRTKSKDVKPRKEGITNSNFDKFVITIVSHKSNIQVSVTPFFFKLISTLLVKFILKKSRFKAYARLNIQNLCKSDC